MVGERSGWRERGWGRREERDVGEKREERGGEGWREVGCTEEG